MGILKIKNAYKRIGAELQALLFVKEMLFIIYLLPFND
jgi:hypothetical protein